MCLYLSGYFDPKALINTYGRLGVQQFQFHRFQFLESEFVGINKSLN
jgi:hypothetical protein